MIILIETMTIKIADQLQSALQSIASATQLADRTAQEVKLLAVSKTKPENMIEQAWQAGQRAFGENYVQEGLQKIQNLQHLEGLEWHLIGPLQSNKCKPVAESFDWVQSVDRSKIARRLNDNRPLQKGPLKVCIQVNISGEQSKSGTGIEQVNDLAADIAALPNLSLRGLMAVPSNTEDDGALGREFQQLYKVFKGLQQKYAEVDTLSMGMSGDMTLAIQNGSTMVRIGTAIFGARNKPANNKN